MKKIKRTPPMDCRTYVPYSVRGSLRGDPEAVNRWAERQWRGNRTIRHALRFRCLLSASICAEIEGLTPVIPYRKRRRKTLGPHRCQMARRACQIHKMRRRWELGRYLKRAR